MTNEYLERLIYEINHDDPYTEANRIQAVSLKEGSSVVEVTVLPEHKNIWGLPHGGLLFVLSLGGYRRSRYEILQRRQGTP